MGSLRLILAICVVIAHSSTIFGLTSVGGRMAVQSFYIISGFYMTLILKEKYIGSNNSYKLFISNRLLRLYPIYWAVLLLAVFFSLGIIIYTNGNHLGQFQVYIDYFGTMKLTSFMFLVVSNIGLVFQDWIMFLGLDTDSGNLFFTTNFSNTDPYLYRFLLIPQAWSIGIEITFYLIAPLIVRRQISVIILLIFLSISLRIFLSSKGLEHDPWTYRFFPTELLFFLLGTLAYHGYKKITKFNILKSNLYLIYGFLLIFTVFFGSISFPFLGKIYFLVFFLSIPFIFILTKNWKIDRYIGELSYPVYISHLLVLYVINFLDYPLIKANGLTVSLITIGISILLNECIVKRIEFVRQNRLKTTSENV